MYERRKLKRAATGAPQCQYELIKECCSSGMTDSQWCMQHGIKLGPFITGLADCIKIPVSTFLNLPVVFFASPFWTCMKSIKL